MTFVAVYMMCGCVLGIVAEVLDGSAGKYDTWYAMVEDVAFTIFAWPWILAAIYRSARE